MDVENPYMVPADFKVKIDAPQAWACTATPTTFAIDSLKDCSEKQPIPLLIVGIPSPAN